MKNLLKKTVLFLGGIFFTALTQAAVIRVTVGNYSFTPKSFTANVGDTVEWVWVNGSHTTTSLDIPDGADSWNNPMNADNFTFDYVIKVAGSYNYWCAIHTTMMEGSFTALQASGIQVMVNSSKAFATVFPNPATSVLNIHFNYGADNNELSIFDMLGNQVVKENLVNIDNAIDVSAFAKGIYIYDLQNSGGFMEGEFVVK